TTDSAVPVAVAGLSSGVAAISAGSSHSCALMVQGNVVCWGYNSAGGLGDATFAQRTRPVVVAREGAGGTIAANDWFLDLNPPVPKSIPPDKIPNYLVNTTGNAETAIVNVKASVQFRPQDAGKPIFVYGYVPVALIKRGARGKDGGCALAQIGTL